MPVYEYRCAGCGRKFSKLYRTMEAAEPASCPGCGRPSADRAISIFAYHASLQTQIETLDPRYEKELAWAERKQGADDPMSRLNLNFDAGDPTA
ncbi:MAG: zinc ribbon domain-containing protein [Dehalococcoidia bacterium]